MQIGSTPCARPTVGVSTGGRGWPIAGIGDEVSPMSKVTALKPAFALAAISWMPGGSAA